MNKETLPIPPAEEKAFLHVYPAVRGIARRRLNPSFQDSVEDLAQRVMLKLWQWNLRRHERWEKTHPEMQCGCRLRTSSGDKVNDNDKVNDSNVNDNVIDFYRPFHELSKDEWQRLANVVIRNEIRSFLAAKDKKEVPLETEMPEDEHLISVAAITKNSMSTQPTLEGNTRYELKSQLCEIWKSFQSLSLREKYALLLKKRQLINYLIASGCCKIKDITDYLELSREEFIEVYKLMPHGDGQIAELLERKLKAKMSSAHVAKARQRAKKRIRFILSGEYDSISKSNKDGTAAFNKGKT